MTLHHFFPHEYSQYLGPPKEFRWSSNVLIITFRAYKRFLWVKLCVCSYLRLIFCDPMDCSPPGSCVHGILQARILEWVAMPSSRGFSIPRDWTYVFCDSSITDRFSTTERPGKSQLHTCMLAIVRKKFRNSFKTLKYV